MRFNGIKTLGTLASCADQDGQKVAINVYDNQTTPQVVYQMQYSYDSAGRLTFVYNGNPIEFTTSYLASLGYDDNGNRSNLAYYIEGSGLGDTVAIDYDYGMQNRLTGYTATGVTFSLDADGTGDVDGLGRLTGATETIGANTYVLDYDYNDRSKLTNWQINTTTGSYGYDLAGNITSDGTDTYSYTGDLLTSVGSNSLAWDYNGALTSNLSSSIVRNPDAQIQSAVVGSDSIACKYTPDGRIKGVRSLFLSNRIDLTVFALLKPLSQRVFAIVVFHERRLLHLHLKITVLASGLVLR
ncbi:MAG: hypothetical protein ACIAQZ_04510 [Sedimentisphaeraceae bacterium JB056]